MKLFEHQNETADFIAKTPRCLVASDPGCVSCDTEFLSQSGWKRIDEYKKGDKVAQYLPECSMIELVEPTEYVKLPCEKMLNIRPARSTDQLLSHDHRVLYYCESTEKTDEILAKDLKEIHDKQKLGFRGRFATAGRLEAEGVPFTENELRILTMQIADGYVEKTKKSGLRCTINLKREDKIKRTEQLLKASGIDFKRYGKNSHGYTRFIYHAFADYKHFPKDFYQCSYSQKEIILDEAQYWDSCQRKNGSFSFSSYVKENADFVQFCAVTTERTASLRAQERENKKTEYVVLVRDRHALVGIKSGSNKSEIKEVKTEDGYKYCFSVPSTFLFLRRNGYTFATGNTGKTLSTIEGFKRSGARRMLVLAPLSILRPAWGDDIEKFAPELSWDIARGTPRKRSEVLAGGADVIITNHEGVNWLINEPKEVLQSFDILVIDESTAFKNKDATRSKNANKLAQLIDRAVLLSGTPTSTTILNIWHQIYMLDKGERLGKNFFKFRLDVCDLEMIHTKQASIQSWKDKPDAEDIVAGAISDIMIRHRFEDCIDIPENTRRYVHVDLPPKLRKAYEELCKTNALLLEEGMINAVHAGAKYQKTLQLLTGAVYTEQGDFIKVHDERYRLVMDLVEARPKSLVAFNWSHERSELCRLAESMGIRYGVIDGKVPAKDRNRVVSDFQNGDLQVIFAHPQSAGHGLTLTKGVATIWCSPTPRPDMFKQFNQRIYRNGQINKTETICIAARDTKEEEVYESLNDRTVRMENLLGLFVDLTRIKKTA